MKLLRMVIAVGGMVALSAPATAQDPRAGAATVDLLGPAAPKQP